MLTLYPLSPMKTGEAICTGQLHINANFLLEEQV